MKTITLILLTCACFAADEPAKTEKPKPITEFPEEATEGEIPGWGARHNPKRTGKYELDGTTMNLTVASDADMNPESNFKGPSVLVEVEGDFVAEVTLAPLPTDHSSWVGGGLLILGPQKQTARFNHAHNRSKREDDFNEVLDWACTDDGGKMRSIKLSAIKFDTTKQRILRIERRGTKLHGALSADGVSWTELYPHNIHRWPAKLRVGPFGLNMSSSPKTLQFTAFKVTPKAK